MNTKTSVFQKIVFCGFALLLMGGLLGCPQQKSIGDILLDPGRYANKEIAIKGTVTHSYGALGTGIYEVDDGTGKLWVFSERYGVPSNGASVGVRGTIIPTFTFAGKSYATVLREQERRR